MDPALDAAIRLGGPLLLLIVTYFIGSAMEAGHYRSIRLRESKTRRTALTNFKTPPPGWQVDGSELVTGSVVISVDYFKRFVAHLRMIFGGRVHTYESLLDRGRREALLRMQAEARKLGATMIFNTRFETSSISKGRRQSVGCVEVLAYGTAILP